MEDGDNPSSDTQPEPQYSVTTPDIVSKRLKYMNRVIGRNWRNIAKSPEYSGIAPGTLCSISKGYIPKSPLIRRQLGLSSRANVEPMYEDVPPGSQVIGASYCILCSRPYISNHPARKRCFICSPYRGRRVMTFVHK